MRGWIGASPETNSKRRISCHRHGFAMPAPLRCRLPGQPRTPEVASRQIRMLGGMRGKPHGRAARVRRGRPRAPGLTGLPPVCVGRAGRADRLPRPLLAVWFIGSEGERGGLRAVARCVSKRAPYSGPFPYLLPPSPSRRWPSRDQKPAALCCSRSRAASAAWMRSRSSAFSRSRPFTRSCRRAFSICRAA